MPVALLFSIGESAALLVRGRPGEALGVWRAIRRGLHRPGRLWRSRRALQRQRSVPDGEVRRLQTRGNARLRAFIRARLDAAAAARAHPHDHSHTNGSLAVEGRAGSADPFGTPPWPAVGGPVAAIEPGETAIPVVGGGTWRLSLGVGVVLFAVLVIGSRSLFGHELPAIGQLPNTSSGIGSWWSSWWSSWRPQGLGVAAASPPALALLGLAGIVFFGAVGTLQHVLVLGPLLIGPFGAYRAARWWGSPRGRVAAMIAYAAAAVPYNALARGHWAGLVVYAAAPWLIALLGRVSGDLPFPHTAISQVVGRTLGAGILSAVVASVAPSFVIVEVVIGVGLAAGAALAGRAGTGLRALGLAVGAAMAATVLLLPWSADVLSSRTAAFGVVRGSSTRLGLGEILRFHTGPVGSGALGWALLVAAALPLVIGRSWRLAWAARLWMVALLCFAWAWAGGRGWVPTPAPEVLLAPAAAALASSVALGAVAFELDLPGYRFGWRQLASGLAAVALLVAVIPVLVGAADGRWHLPSADPSTALAFLPDNHAGDYRVLWAGDPDALPLASRYLAHGVGYATSYDGLPDVTDTWGTSRSGATPLIATDLRLVEGNLTTKVGHLLAPMAVRFIVVPNHNGPVGSGAASMPPPASLLSGLQLQTDLQLINSDADYTVYQNSAWLPARAVLSPSVTALATGPSSSTQSAVRQLEQTSLTGATPALTGTTPTSGRGQLAAGTELYVSATRSSQWQLHVGGRAVSPTRAFGWAMAFAVPASGTATLQAGGSFGDHLGQLVDVVLWVVAVAVVSLDVRRRRRGGAAETVASEWFVPMSPGTGRGAWRRAYRETAGSEDDDVWVDV